MMYKEYFGLKEEPFSIAPDPHYLYISDGHREALAHLMYGINSNGGFVLLTGEVGTGKTTVCRCLLQQIPENCELAFIINPKLSSIELLASICDEFKIVYSNDNETIKDLVKRINDFLIHVSEKGRKAILIIEEAQNLSVEVLEQIRLLTNLETNQRKLLQIIMIGQPELKEVLAKPELRQLSQRITARYHLGPLAKEEIASYVNHRLSVAGLARGELFPPPVIKKLYALTGGVPRLINILCDRALLGTYTQGKASVDKQTLITAAHEVSGNSKSWWQNKRIYPWATAIVLTVALIAGTWYYLHATGFLQKTESAAASAKPVPSDSNEKKEVIISGISSRDAAYMALFHAWQIAYDPKDNRTACEQAQSQGLRCYEGRESLKTLRQINKPVLLRLVDTQGRDYYITLTALQDNQATYTTNNDTKTGHIDEIILGWHGEYELLWRLPREYQDTLGPGGQGPIVAWLDKQLSLIGGKRQNPRPKSRYDEEMVKQVVKFQSEEGLKPDGIVGPTTIGRLIMKTGSVGPTLDDKMGVN